jgi:hypothetical protein
MQAITTIGLDIAKSVFQVHGVDTAGQALIRRQLKRRTSSALRLYIANYFRSSAPRYGLVDPTSRLAFRIERPRRSREGSKKTAVEIKPPLQDGINNPVVVRQDSNVQVISGKFLGDPLRQRLASGVLGPV